MTTSVLEEPKIETAEKPEIIDQYLGDVEHPIEWKDEAEKQLHFWYDDPHNPQPVSPMYYDLGAWWATCAYMYRRFGAPFGKDWVAKNVDEYVLTAIVPRDAKDAADIAPYYNMVMPVYADKFLGWWKSRLLPEIKRNFEYLDTFDMENACLAECMILLEDMIDIQERHFRLHWILNLAQFQASLTFNGDVAKYIGPGHDGLIGRILVSDEDRNWDSIRELWNMKGTIKKSPVLLAVFKKPTEEVLGELTKSAEGKDLLKKIHAYAFEYGNKAMYTHEFVHETWRENPTPVAAALKGYVESDYDYPQAVQHLREDRAKAIEELWVLFPKDGSAADREALQKSLDLALKMTPLTPDHHFYMDQGTYARTHLVLMGIGRKLAKAGVLNEPMDVMYLVYDELRKLSANFKLFDAKALVKARRAKRDAAFNHKGQLWCGTITHWSLFEEPYKALWGWPDVYLNRAERADLPKGSLVGLGVSAGTVEGIAHVVRTPAQFDEVQKGEILVCQMTNPAWVVLFTKIAAVVTDSGGALSHPAVVAREFHIPAVVGTINATEKLKTGQKIRVDGLKGTVEIIG